MYLSITICVYIYIHMWLPIHTFIRFIDLIAYWPIYVPRYVYMWYVADCRLKWSAGDMWWEKGIVIRMQIHMYAHIYISKRVTFCVSAIFIYHTTSTCCTCITSSVHYYVSIHIYPSIHPSIYLSSHPSTAISSNPINRNCSLQDTPISHHRFQPLTHSIGLFGKIFTGNHAFPHQIRRLNPIWLMPFMVVYGGTWWRLRPPYIQMVSNLHKWHKPIITKPINGSRAPGGGFASLFAPVAPGPTPEAGPGSAWLSSKNGHL